MDQSTIDARAINAIRTLSMDAVQRAKSGHPGAPMGLAPLSYLLWTRHLRYNPANPDWPGRDRFVLSCGHASMLLYSLLHLTGFDLSLEEIRQFRQWGSRTPGHPEAGHTPGVEVTSGPLGQGISNAVGMAMASRLLAQRFNRPGHEIVSHRIVALCSDGDLMEGVASEAASLAGLHRLGNLVAFYDDNRITIEGSTALAFREDVGARFRAYGWNVLRVEDGNTDLDGLSRAIGEAFACRERPTLAIVRTTIAYGSPNKGNSAESHGSPLGETEVGLTKDALGWPREPAFHVPEDVLARFREAVPRGERLEREWRLRIAEYQRAFPDLAFEWERVNQGDLPEGWADALPSFPPGSGPVATRSASKKVLNAIAARVPELAGGSADLAPSTETILEGAGEFLPDAPPGGRNFHFGVREHGMGAILNGMARHGGVLPYGATFLVFSDYMRGSIRLAALMGIRVIYVFTHDSIGVGEDGPTHQPVEHLASLRAVPNLHVVRPADANETAAAWKLAMERAEGPTALILSRQKLPVLPPAGGGGGGDVSRGAYIYEEGAGNKARVALLASGSELHVALAAKKLLEQEGISSRVVSFPCWERFEEQPAEYRDAVLPPGIRARVSVEAGSTLGWVRYVGEKGAAVGIDRFGASAPADRLFREYGITPENVAAKAKALLAGSSKGRGGMRKKGNPLVRLGSKGQSPWLDYIHRALIGSGELARLVAEDGITGVTSNPSIFEKAISEGAEYDDQLRALASAGKSPVEAYVEIATEDIRRAADVLRPVYDSTGGADGYVSLEVDPDLAFDTARTVSRARELFGKVSRPNVLIKIPATREGLPAIEETVAAGIPVNVTLLFSVKTYEEVAQAYLRGVERRIGSGGDPRAVASVASLFVSRVDTAVDKLLQEAVPRFAGSPRADLAVELQGKVAVANARLVYARFRSIFASDRWKGLAAKGARVQRPLWASTGTKNPLYSDVKYVEELVGPDTVNTIPPGTLDAFRDHGTVRDGLSRKERSARSVLDDLGLLGIGIEEVCESLLRDGVRSFAGSFDKLLAAIGRRLAP